MRLVCLLVGCRWDAGLPLILLGGERIKWHLCERCGAHRYVAHE